MKYIITSTEDFDQEIFIFPRTINHDIMAESISRMKNQSHGNWKRLTRTPIAAATNGDIARTRANETRIKDCTNANVRPRTSSSTSSPSMVNPVTQEIPANKPRSTVIKIANTRFNINERVTSKIPEIVKDIPNKRLLENCEKTLGPKEIPSAKPRNTEPNKTPYAASPAFKSSTNVLANPII